MWVGALAMAVLAIILILDTTGVEVGSHHSVMLGDHPETVTIAANEPPLQTARADVHKGFKPTSRESSEYKPLESRVEARSDDSRFANNDELSQQRDDTVFSPTEQNPALTMSKFDKGSVEPGDTEAPHGDETVTVSNVAEIPQDVPEGPAPAAASPSVTVASSQAITDAVDMAQPPEPSVEQEDTAMTEQAVVTDSKVEVAVVEVSRVHEPVSREDRIIELLSLAQRALRSDRLLIPENNNAYQYYQQVLELEPGNSAALFGMDQIVERYVSLGREALDRQDKDKARRYIARGSRVLPGDSRLVALQDSLTVPEQPKIERPEVQVEAQPLVAETKPKEKNLFSWFKGIFGEGQSADQKKHEVPVEDHSY
jgi:hypothetical protein